MALLLGLLSAVAWPLVMRLALPVALFTLGLGSFVLFGAVVLGLSFVIPGISWGGHVGGLIGGILVMLAYGHWGGRGRAQYGQLGLGGVLGLVVVGVGSVALAYFRVRGLA